MSNGERVKISNQRNKRVRGKMSTEKVKIKKRGEKRPYSRHKRRKKEREREKRQREKEQGHCSNEDGDIGSPTTACDFPADDTWRGRCHSGFQNMLQVCSARNLLMHVCARI